MAFQKNKKVKTTHEEVDREFREFLNGMIKERQTHPTVREFKYNVKRIRILTDVKLMPLWSKGVLYWMTREMRVQDNWSFLYAQKLALERQLPLHVCFSQKKKFLDSSIRNFRFMLKGLEEVSEECKKLDIPFHMLLSDPTEKTLADFISENKFGCVVTDFHPLRIITGWIEELKKVLPEDVPLHQVDGHNIVPCWVASDKLEYGARTIRNKINDRLPDYLSTFPPLVKHPHIGSLNAEEINWSKVESFLEVDRTVADADWAVPGYMGGITVLYEFIKKRLINFSSKRNDPLGDALSNLSPWLHFGQISVQRCILEVGKSKHRYKASVKAFFEEAIVRRELADNFCFYNPDYDKLEGAYDWAKKTLEQHKKDKRVYLYTREELEKSLTHDDLWNSAQIQLVKEAKMHGFLRMYWAKKILEWTATPEEALATAIWLNDKYNLDGRDPNGYVGCMWSICGIHDQGWKERDIFGKIRYMNYEGCKRKFDVSAFVARYGGKVHEKK